jgi:Amt family ammonium transporter
MALELAAQAEALWWLLCVGFLFLGLVGLSLIEAGMSRSAFTEAALIKNVVQFALASICWWLLGQGFSFGHVDFGFLGVEQFGGKGWEDTLTPLTATAIGFVGVSVVFIINGAVAERATYTLYFVMTCVLLLFAWPVVVAWNWGKGWLYNMADQFMDDGGCATVHLFAGTVALAGVLFVKSRPGRYEREPFTMANTVLLTLGTVFYFIHLCFLNALIAPSITTKGYAMFNTWLGAGMSAITACLIGSFIWKKVETQFIIILRGFIAGAVIMSSIADNVAGWESFCSGVIAGVIFIVTYWLEERLGVDDMTLVLPTHLVPGIVGTFCVGLWNNDMGGFHNNTGLLLGTQLAGLVAIFFWALAFGIGIFGFLYLLEFLVMGKDLQEGVETATLTPLGFKSASPEEIELAKL